MMVFAVTFSVAVINSHYQSIYILEQDRFSLFSGRDRILNLIGELLVIAIAQHTILPTYLRDIVYEIYVISRNLVARLHMEIIQHVSYFTNRVQETKMLM